MLYNLDRSFRLFLSFSPWFDVGFVYLSVCAHMLLCVCVCASAYLNEARQHPAAPTLRNTPFGIEQKKVPDIRNRQKELLRLWR